MAPPLLLMAKLLVLELWVGGSLPALGDLHLPFLPSLDAWQPHAGVFRGLVLTLFFAAAALLFFNVSVRAACGVLGMTVLLSLLAAKPQFRNHIAIVGFLLLLAGLHRAEERPWLIHGQYALVYFGAFLNKLLDADWWHGRFMHAWLGSAHPTIFYQWLTTWLPAGFVSRALSWTAMSAELAVLLLLLRPRTRPAAVWVILLFHGGIFVFTVGARFGHFLEALMIGLLAFLHWPRGEVRYDHDDRAARWCGPLLRLLDWDRKAVRGGIRREPGCWLAWQAEDGRHAVNLAALRHLLGYSTGFYVGLFVADLLVSRLMPWKAGFILTVLAGLAVVLVFLPTPLCPGRRRPIRPAAGLTATR
jgi:hypothetical protein